MKRILKIFLLAILLVFLALVGYFSIGSTKPAPDIAWGVNFSQKHAALLGLDWKTTYLAVFDDLGAKNVKIITNWDFLEPEREEYNFADLDWQIKTAKEHGAKIFLVIGMKTGHWPECHIPEWAAGLTKKEQQEKILQLLESIVLRYKDSEILWAWQVENEALFPFGECPWQDKTFLKKEIELVKSLDPQRPIIISDSGEYSFWVTAAGLGDMVSTTLHRKVWFEEIKTYLTYPLRPVFYWRKSQIIKKFFEKEIILGELQAEPWCPTFLIYGCAVQEQQKTMNLEQFQKNVEFAKKTGLKEIYLWGAEWIYWMKMKQNQPEIWQEAQKLFQK